MMAPVGSYAVIFSSQEADLSEARRAAYQETAAHMFQLAAAMPGYLGVESFHQKDGTSVTISYWENDDAIKAWREEIEHTEARARGKAEWYKTYSLKVARIERAYGWQAVPTPS